MLENNLQPEIKINLFANLFHMKFMKIHLQSNLINEWNLQSQQIITIK